MSPPHESGGPGGDLHPPAVLAPAAGPQPMVAGAAYAPERRQPDWRFLVRSPWHLIALGFGSGLPRIAPGTWGTLFGWISFIALDRYVTDAQMAGLIGIAFAVGALASHRTGTALGIIDSGHIVIDEIVAFWAVLFMLPERAPGWFAAVAFLLFRVFDIVKPAPIRRLDARIKNGFGVMLDDAVAAFYTLLVLAILWRLLRG